MPKKIELKRDRFRKARGGHSRWLLISCGTCSAPLLVYQKDGPGMLKRLYLDRIVVPTVAQNRKNFSCAKCRTLLGIATMYEKEKRSVLRLFVGAVSKRLIGESEIRQWYDRLR